MQIVSVSHPVHHPIFLSILFGFFVFAAFYLIFWCLNRKKRSIEPWFWVLWMFVPIFAISVTSVLCKTPAACNEFTVVLTQAAYLDDLDGFREGLKDEGYCIGREDVVVVGDGYAVLEYRDEHDRKSALGLPFCLWCHSFID